MSLKRSRRAFRYHGSELDLRRKQTLQIGWRRMHSRIHHDGQRSGQGFARHGQSHSIDSGKSQRPLRCARRIVRHRRDASGKVKEESVTLDDDVQDQDVIYVKESLF